MHDTSEMPFEKVNACRMNKSFTLLAGITELDIENSNSTSDPREKFSILPIHSPIPSPTIINTRDLSHLNRFPRWFYRWDSFGPIYPNYPVKPWPIIVADLRMIETWEIWKGDGTFYDPWLVSIRTLQKKKKKKGTEFAAARFYDPFGDLFHRTIVERVVPTERNRVVRYDRERSLVNVSQNVSFIAIVFQSKETLDSSLFFSFPPLPYSFLPNSVARNILESWWIPSGGFPKLENRCFESIFRGERKKKKKEKNKLKGKDFTDASRASGLKRVRTIQAESVLLFTLHGIHSSPAKRVKTQKSESLFVTSFDVAINSFEITAGYTVPNIRQPAAIFSRKFKISANRRLGFGSQFKRVSSSSLSSSWLEYLCTSSVSISPSARYLENDSGGGGRGGS